MKALMAWRPSWERLAVENCGLPTVEPPGLRAAKETRRSPIVP